MIEYVSGDGSDERDDTPETGKFWVYERGIRAAYYAIYDPNTLSLDVFELARDRYHAMTPDTHGRFRIPGMGLTLGTWDGEYQGCATTWLRGWDLDGNLIPTPEEVAERLQERADKFAAKLRELGLNPDDL